MSSALGQRLHPICVFSKHLHWVDGEQLGPVVAALGFDGVDLTVRPDGHVKPERAREDLPRVVRAIRASGVRVDMLTTAICSAREPFAEEILRTASELDIPLYRMGWLRYQTDLPLDEQLPGLALELRGLAELNRQCGIRGAYQNHAGSWVGAAVWDLWLLLKDVDTTWLGVQYDIRHAMVESAHAWVQGFHLIARAINSLVIKDYAWVQSEGRWSAESVPLGTGAVRLADFLALLRQTDVAGPVSLHYEYPLGGADRGSPTPTLPGQAILDALRRDLLVWKDVLNRT